MTQLLVETPEGVCLRFDVAGAGSRSAAACLDLALFVLAFLAAFLVLLVAASLDPTGLSRFASGLLAGGGLLLLSLYQVLFAILWEGQSPGKRLLGIRVVDAHGYPARAPQHLLRSLFWPLEVFLFVPVSLGILLMLLSARRQRLGDLVAGTLVVRDARIPQESEPYVRQDYASLPRKRLELTPAVAARFDLADVSYLRSLFARRGLESGARRALFVKSARHYARVLGCPPPQHAREGFELLRELYVFLRETRRH